MEDKMVIKVNNLESQYRTLKGDVQIASEELTKVYDEVKKSKQFLIKADGILKEKNDLSKKLDIKELNILNNIQKEKQLLIDTKNDLKVQEIYRRQSFQKIIEEKEQVKLSLSEVKKEVGIFIKESNNSKNELLRLNIEISNFNNELKGLKDDKNNLLRLQQLEQKKLSELNNLIINKQRDFDDLNKLFQGMMNNINSYKERCHSIEQTLRTKEKDLNILAIRLKEEYKKLGREIPIKEVEIPKYNPKIYE